MDSAEDSSSESTPPNCCEIMDKDLHVTFLEMMYHLLPSPYESQEINHLTLAYFVISGLDILNALHRVEKDAVANWVLSFQVHPGTKADLNNGQFYGFHGSRTSQFPPDENGVLLHNNSHLASTYCALAILKIVGYKLSNLDSESMLTSMRNLQQPDGSFMPIHTGGETDLRFVYCAAAICFMLDNWSGMDKEKAMDYILHCQSYDGGFGLVPGAESHGGATYCAIASLRLMGFIEDNILSSCASSSLIDVPLLLDWILQRQGNDGGFQGRRNKPSDTCYAFWIGAVLRILGGCNFVDNKALRGFLLACQYQQIPWRVSRPVPLLLWICCFQPVGRIWLEFTLF
ncbi:geranylgeranyl transferase type-1 subunit beta isoform X2 [Gastrolobium bilobum]|uniref:geranylgeranyl transferase type-1 subunit beta isoform X2 n=1 Tax=Gastrolobium bilobum TaxID=150636 RepID=UPI002AAF83B4|nr:geranylgeranyl transferase type-1 subunit beta isoform X2 [Gastrolobium bilobum]